MKHVVQRTCVACRRARPKKAMIRVVRAPDGSIRVDETGKANGRGAYLCRCQQCWHQAIGGTQPAPKCRLTSALKAVPTESEWTVLQKYARQLPEVDNTRSGILS
jgi:predicted RNA-binding protein YlxR (DUF448 family)